MRKIIFILICLILSVSSFALAQNNDRKNGYSFPGQLIVDNAEIDAHQALKAKVYTLLTVKGLGAQIPGTDPRDRAELISQYGTREVDMAVSEYYGDNGRPLSDMENAERYAESYNKLILAFRNNTFEFDGLKPVYTDVISVPFSVKNKSKREIWYSCDVHERSGWKYPRDWKNMGLCAYPGQAAQNHGEYKPPEKIYYLNAGETRSLVWPYLAPGESKKKAKLVASGTYRFMANIDVPGWKDKWGIREPLYVFSEEFTVINTKEKISPATKKKDDGASTFGGIREIP